MKEYVADFETSDKDGEAYIWIGGQKEVESDIITYCTSIQSYFSLLHQVTESSIIYFHNLTFDGSYIINELLIRKYKQVFSRDDLQPHTFSISINDFKSLFSLTICIHSSVILTFNDTLKIFPVALAKVPAFLGLADGLKKLHISAGSENEDDYYRPKHHIPTFTEIAYLRNDLLLTEQLVLTKKANDMKKITTASNAMYEFKRSLFNLDATVSRKNPNPSNKKVEELFQKFYPSLSDNDYFFTKNSYAGGVSFLNPKYKAITLSKCYVYDVNSMYPSVMYEKYLPIGVPTHTTYKLSYITNYLKKQKETDTFITRLSIHAICKPSLHPCIKITGVGKEPYPREFKITKSFTNVDLSLLLRFYDIKSISFDPKMEELGYNTLTFSSSDRMFKPYIDHWMKEKSEGKCTGNSARTSVAKLFLNSLYGKFGAKKEMTDYILSLEESKVKYNKHTTTYDGDIYIPVATFVTAYAREKLFNMINENADRFIYCDTDSVHLISPITDDSIIDPIKLGLWDLEAICSTSRYLRAKTYVHTIYNKKTQRNELEVKACGATLSAVIDDLNQNGIETFDFGYSNNHKKAQKTLRGGKTIIETSFKIKDTKGGLFFG